MMMRVFARALLLVGAIVTVFSCSGDKEPAKGQLMVALQTDMSVPKDVNRIRVQIYVDDRVQYDATFAIKPDGDYGLPGTLAVVAGEREAPTVQVRVIGIRQRSSSALVEARTFSKVVTTVPRNRIATLRVPVQWLCEGSAIEVASETYESNCDSVGGVERACVAGECKDVRVDEATLPSYSAPDVYGGGLGPDDFQGACFPTVECFRGGFDVTPNPDCTVRVAVPPTGALNFAIKLPPGSDGICDEQGDGACYVPIDQSERYGWREVGAPGRDGGAGGTGGGGSSRDASAVLDASGSGQGPGADDLGAASSARRPQGVDTESPDAGHGQKLIQLPAAVCAKLTSGRTLRVSTTHPPKLERYPTCGPWSSVVSQTVAPRDDGGIISGDCPEFRPGSPVPAITGNGTLDSYLRVASELRRAADTLKLNTANACAKAATGFGSPQQTFSSTPADSIVTTTCSAAGAAFRKIYTPTQPPFSMLVTPGYCSVDIPAQTACEEGCPRENPCEQPPPESRCSSRGGTCSGICSGDCQGTVESPVNCSDLCQGTCLGSCQGTCTTPDGSEPTTPCNGWCSGTCNGPCAGTCYQTATCNGVCWELGDIGEGSCEGTLSNLKCRVPLDPNTCDDSHGACDSACALLAAVRQQCVPTRVNVFAFESVTPPVRSAVEMNFGPLFDTLLQSSGYAHATAWMDFTELTQVANTVGPEAAACVATANRVLAEATLSIQRAISAASDAVNPSGEIEGGISFPDGSTQIEWCFAGRSRGLGNAPVIDDFEDQNPQILPNDLRSGQWFAYGEGGSRTFVNPAPPTTQRTGSAYALRASSATLEAGLIPHGGVGFDLRPDMECYDASAYPGLQFWGIGPGRVEVAIRTASAGNACLDPQNCDYHRYAIDLGRSWASYTIPWSAFVQNSGAGPLDPRDILSIYFHSPAQGWNFWIDDVSFSGSVAF
jgi:hypothetical protein